MDTLRKLAAGVTRQFVRKPGYSITVLVTLALGIGATTAVFTLVISVLLKPLPYPDPDRLVGLWYNAPSPSGPARVRQSEATYLHLRDRGEVFDAVALAQPITATFDDGERPTRIPAATVTATIFDVLGVAPARGRPLTVEDNQPQAEPVVVLTDAFWEAMFGRRPGVLGEVIRIDGVSRRVVGILPAEVRFPGEDTRLWIPQTIDESDPLQMIFFHAGYGRLEEGATLDLAYDDVQRLIFSIPDVYSEFPKEVVGTGQITPIILPLRDQLVGETSGSLWLLLLAAGGLFLAACVNVANLALVRLEGRMSELAIRRALGATYSRLVTSLLAESLALALVGGVVGLAIARVALHLFLDLAPVALPRSSEIRIDPTVICFAAGLSLLAGLLSGGIPAMRRLPASSALAGASRSMAETESSQRIRGALVVGQVAVAVVLLVGSGLIVRSFLSLRKVDPGFAAADVVGMRVALPEGEYGSADLVGQYYRLALESIRGLPGVKSAAAVTHLPLRDNRIYLNYEAEGSPPDPLEVTPSYLTKIVSEGYFETLGIELLRGRTLQTADEDVSGDVPVVVSSVFADRYWPAGEALGRRFRAVGREVPWLTVVGVVESVRDRSLTEEPQGIVYLPFLDYYIVSESQWRDMSLAVNADQASDLVPAIRNALLRIDASVPVYDVRTMESVLRDAAGQTRFVALLLALSAIGALYLGGIGLYGVMAYSVEERRKELGVRLALGAYPAQLQRMVARQAFTMTASGLVIGGGLSMVLARLFQGLLYGVLPADPVTLGAVSSLLFLVSLAAAGFPSRRAARTDPAAMLREH